MLVCVPSDWNSNVTSLVIPVTLKEGENKLEVLLYGPQRGKISLDVTHEVDAKGAAYVDASGGMVWVDDHSSELNEIALAIPEGAVTEPTLISIHEPLISPPITRRFCCQLTGRVKT